MNESERERLDEKGHRDLLVRGAAHERQSHLCAVLLGLVLAHIRDV